MSLNVYRISSVGGCAKALAAPFLGYDPVSKGPPSPVLREGQRQEKWVAEDLIAEGYEIEDAGVCQQCLVEFEEERDGFHVEYSTYLFRLVGHVDRKVRIDGVWYPVEIKSMGFFPFSNFKKTEDIGLGYDGQISAYTGIWEAPALYVIKSRDSGQMVKYTYPYKGQAIPGFPVLTQHQTFENIIEKITWIELCVQDNDLPACTQQSYCDFPYLCSKKEIDVGIITDEGVTTAATQYAEGKQLKDAAEEQMEYAKAVLMKKAREVPKFSVGGVSVSYNGMKRRRFLSAILAKEKLEAHVLESLYEDGKEYEDLRITVHE